MSLRGVVRKDDQQADLGRFLILVRAPDLSGAPHSRIPCRLVCTSASCVAIAAFLLFYSSFLWRTKNRYYPIRAVGTVHGRVGHPTFRRSVGFPADIVRCFGAGELGDAKSLRTMGVSLEETWFSCMTGSARTFGILISDAEELWNFPRPYPLRIGRRKPLIAQTPKNSKTGFGRRFVQRRPKQTESKVRRLLLVALHRSHVSIILRMTSGQAVDNYLLSAGTPIGDAALVSDVLQAHEVCTSRSHANQG